MTAHRREVAALLAVVRPMLAELAKHRGVPAPAAAAVTLMERWLGGEAVDRAALLAAQRVVHEDGVPRAQREPDRARAFARAAVGNVAWVAQQPRAWKQGHVTVVDMVACAYGVLDAAALPDRDAVMAQLGAARDAATAAPPTKAARATPAERAARPRRVRAELARYLGAVAQARLATLAPTMDPAATRAPAALRALLAERDYPAHAAVLAFEARYGGLALTDADGDTWRFGAAACVSSDDHVAPRGGRPHRGTTALVPVVYAPADVIYFLDGRGRGWVEDTIEGGLVACADRADAMVARLLLDHLEVARRARDRVRDVDGPRGRALARTLTLPAIREATDERARCWGDAHTLIIERRVGRTAWRTTISSDRARTLAAIADLLA